VAVTLSLGAIETTNIILAAAAAVTAVVTAGALWAALKGVRDELWLQTFAEYTRRYNEIAKEIPAHARGTDTSYDLATLGPDERGRILNLMRAYANLCSEEHYLHKKKRIDRTTWDIWKMGIESMFEYRWFRQAWADLRTEYSAYQEFIDYFNGCYDRAEAASSER
jgi:hypothetical protein